ncbi:MAG: hypothetical protein FIO03_08760 [Nitrosopumilales archaeon]|nr:hypothetical protein [Nitrosopumilales archaeon]
MTAIIAKVIISSCHSLIPQREDGTGLSSQAVTKELWLSTKLCRRRQENDNYEMIKR